MRREDEHGLEEAARWHAALAHPVRVAVLRLLRAQTPTPMADLRKLVSRDVRPLDTRTLQHHVGTMADAGLVDVERLGGRDLVHLVRDVRLRVRPVAPR